MTIGYAISIYAVVFKTCLSDTCELPDPSFEIQRDGKFYRAFGAQNSGERKQFYDARAHCSMLNSYLAMGRTEDEMDVIRDLGNVY